MDHSTTIGQSPQHPQKISLHDLEPYRDTISDLYLTQGLTLTDVQAELRRKYGLLASEKQYKMKLKSWGFHKYYKNTRVRGRSEYTAADEPLKSRLSTNSTAKFSLSYHENGAKASQVTKGVCQHCSCSSSTSRATSPQASIEDTYNDFDGTYSMGTLGHATMPETPNRVRRQEDAASPATSKSSHNNAPETSVFLACPFYKENPLRYSGQNVTELEYRNCGSAILRSIPALKQHLIRVHKRPDRYCRRCFKVFDEAAEFHEHVRDLDCKPQKRRFDEKISDDVYYQLKKRCRGPDNEVWYAIWRRIFPDRPLPTSPFIDIDLDHELISHIVHLFNCFTPQMIDDVLHSLKVLGHGALPGKTRQLVLQALTQVVSTSQEVRLPLSQHATLGNDPDVRLGIASHELERLSRKEVLEDKNQTANSNDHPIRAKCT